MLPPKPPRSDVPCNGCTACCRGDLIVLHPEDGDDITAYETERMLKRTAENNCIYLGPEGCTIHDRAPVICREFDCRRMFKMLSRKERRRAIKIGFMDQEVLAAGRERVHTLGDD
jgi:Fe-S-cluster containining protein